MSQVQRSAVCGLRIFGLVQPEGLLNPDPPTENNLDHLFVTRVGMVDVPPRLCGTYDELAERAVGVDVGGVSVKVCALEEVLRRLRGRQRKKDLERAALYTEMEKRAQACPLPMGVPWLLARLGPGTDKVHG